MTPNSTGTRTSFRLTRWVSAYAKRRWSGLAVVLATMLAKIVLDLLRPWPMVLLVDTALRHQPATGLLVRLVDHLPGGHADFSLVLWSVGGTVVLFLLAWLLGAVSAVANVSFGKRLSYDLAGDLFVHLQRLSLRFHHRRSTGDSIRRVLVDSGCVSTIVKDAAIPVLTSVITLAVMFAVLWRLNAPLALLSILVVPFMAWTFRRYAEPMTQTSYEQQEQDSRIYTTIEQTLESIPAIQAFCREADADAALLTATNDTLAATLVATDVQLKFKILIGAATSLGTAGMLWLGASQVLQNHLTVGQLLVFLSYLGSLYGPLEVLAYTSSTVQSAGASARRVLEVLDTTQDVPEVRHARSPETLAGDVRFENVTVGYEADRPVLRDLTAHVPAGTTVAIVGPTGAGKSTLAGLVPRFADPWSGRVLLDGHDLRDLPLKCVRESVALVLQDSFLFPISIADNIAYGCPGATTGQIEAAARAANAHEFISRLPDGYATVVGERGATLSGGERQRVSIARALLKNAPVLILDEPTASLDVRTEASVLEAFERLSEGRTTFVIAHRLSTIQNADVIWVIDQGGIAEQGTHAVLARANGMYARLCEHQFGTASALAAEVA